VCKIGKQKGECYAPAWWPHCPRPPPVWPGYAAQSWSPHICSSYTWICSFVQISDSGLFTHDREPRVFMTKIVKKKPLIYLLASMKDNKATGESLQPSNENIQHFKHKNLFTFSIFVVHFCPPVSGSSWPISMRNRIHNSATGINFSTENNTINSENYLCYYISEVHAQCENTKKLTLDVVRDHPHCWVFGPARSAGDQHLHFI
jgi:hypothetical protein